MVFRLVLVHLWWCLLSGRVLNHIVEDSHSNIAGVELGLFVVCLVTA